MLRTNDLVAMSWRYKLPVSKMNKLGYYLTAILSSIYGSNAADNLGCESELIVDSRTHSSDRLTANSYFKIWSPWQTLIYKYHRNYAVEVALPWESFTYVSQESPVYINCTAESSQNPGWTIQLPGRTAILQFTFPESIRTLNDHGFYQLSEVDLRMTMKTIQLLINSTVGINGTLVKCDNLGEATLIAQTILVVYGKFYVALINEHACKPCS